MKRKRSSRGPLTAAEKAFYDGFTPLFVNADSIKAGDRVIVCGDHPHSGAVGVFVGFELTMFGEYPLIKFENPHNGVDSCFITKPGQWRKFR